jgi:hypothetical protein
MPVKWSVLGFPCLAQQLVESFCKPWSAVHTFSLDFSFA